MIGEEIVRHFMILDDLCYECQRMTDLQLSVTRQTPKQSAVTKYYYEEGMNNKNN